jgi:AraC-like DNA-binding protein
MYSGMDVRTLLPILVNFACAALGLLMTLLLLVERRGNRHHNPQLAANRWLAAYIACLSLLWIENVLEETRLILRWPHAAHLPDWLIFLVGPCLWMYVRRLTLHETPRIRGFLVHGVLAGLCLWLLATRFYFLPAETKIEVMRADLALPADFINWPLVMAAIQIMGYWIASLIVLRRFNTGLRERYSFLGERSFNWLRSMLLITLGMWLLWVAGLVLRSAWWQWVAAVGVPPGLYLLAFFGLRQRAVPPMDEEAAAPPLDEKAPTAPDFSAPRYARSGLDRERVPELLARLDSVTRLEKPWLEPDLTLGALATRTGLSQHNLSQLLNEELGKTFFDYVNEQRVEEVKRCLLDPAYASQTILEIALASGFSSKTAFNSAFRQYTGVTPSAFRRQQRAIPSGRTTRSSG